MGFGTRSGRRRARWLPVAAAGAVVLAAMVAGSPAGASSGTGAAAAAGAHASRPRSPATTYYLALGDSLAAGVGASPAADGYVNLVHQHELSRFPGLQLENLSCSGATTGTMLDGGGACSYPAGSQLGEAEAFLQAHRGQVAFVTIDIGANNVDGCVSGISFDLACVQINELQAGKALTQCGNGIVRACSDSAERRGDTVEVDFAHGHLAGQLSRRRASTVIERRVPAAMAGNSNCQPLAKVTRPPHMSGFSMATTGSSRSFLAT